jgi:TonB family protein
MATEAAIPYQLKSDLAQFCFPAASRDSYAKYAYANSIFLSLLIIGVVGIAKTPVITEKAMPEVQDFLPVDLPPPVDTPPPVEPEEITDAPVEPPPPDAFTPIVVAPANANVAFSVPVEGNVLVAPTVALASAPPAVLRRPPPPTAAPPPAPSVVRMTRGKGGPPGVFPNPPFIPNLLKSGESASVEIYLEVDADGTKTLVEVKRASGVRELDQKVLQHVRTRWRFEPVGEPRKYTWEYVMQVN